MVWANPDGSEGGRAAITLTVVMAEIEPPFLTAASIVDGSTDVEPKSVNGAGITDEFSEGV